MILGEIQQVFAQVGACPGHALFIAAHQVFAEIVVAAVDPAFGQQFVAKDVFLFGGDQAFDIAFVAINVEDALVDEQGVGVPGITAVVGAEYFYGFLGALLRQIVFAQANKQQEVVISGAGRGQIPVDEQRVGLLGEAQVDGPERFVGEFAVRCRQKGHVIDLRRGEVAVEFDIEDAQVSVQGVVAAILFVDRPALFEQCLFVKRRVWALVDYAAVGGFGGGKLLGFKQHFPTAEMGFGGFVRSGVVSDQGGEDF